MSRLTELRSLLSVSQKQQKVQRTNDGTCVSIRKVRAKVVRIETLQRERPTEPALVDDAEYAAACRLIEEEYWDKVVDELDQEDREPIVEDDEDDEGASVRELVREHLLSLQGLD